MTANEDNEGKTENLSEMKRVETSFYYVDFIEREAKEELDIRLTNAATGGKPQSENWLELPGISHTVETRSLRIVPDLSDFQKLTASTLSYDNQLYAYVVKIEGILSETMPGYNVDSKIRDARKKFVNYSKALTGGIIAKFGFDLLNSPDGLLIRYSFVSFSGSSSLPGVQKATPDSLKEFRKHPILGELGLNTLGIMSLYQLFENQVIILGQGRSVFGSWGFDLSELVVLEFARPIQGQGRVKETVVNRLIQLLLSIFWTRWLLTAVPKWKESVARMRLSVNQMPSTKALEDLQVPVTDDQGKFLAQYARIIDEQRSCRRHAEFDEELSRNPFYGETAVFGGASTRGLFEELRSQIFWNVDRVKEEYDVLRRQYQLLSQHMQNSANFAMTNASLRLAASNERLTSRISWLTEILVLFTAILAGFQIWSYITPAEKATPFSIYAWMLVSGLIVSLAVWIEVRSLIGTKISRDRRP